MVAGPKSYDNHTALVGDDAGYIRCWTIAPSAIHYLDRFFAEPRRVRTMVVRLPTINYPTPDYGLSINPPIDVDDMIQGVLDERPRVIPRPLMPTISYRDLQLTGWTVGRLRVYCAFDPVERVWYVYAR